MLLMRQVVLKSFLILALIVIVSNFTSCYKKSKCSAQFETFDAPIIEILDGGYSVYTSLEGVLIFNDSISFNDNFILNSDVSKIDFRTKSVVFLNIPMLKLKKRYIDNFHYQIKEELNGYKLLINLCTQRDVKIPGYVLKKNLDRKSTLLILNKVNNKPISYEIIKDF